MEKEKEVKDIYEGKISVEDRVLLLICGIFCFPVGIALYYYFLDKKGKEYHAKFVKMGVTVGLSIIVFFLLLGLFSWLAWILCI